jgi:hypothetical protein
VNSNSRYAFCNLILFSRLGFPRRHLKRSHTRIPCHAALAPRQRFTLVSRSRFLSFPTLWQRAGNSYGQGGKCHPHWSYQQMLRALRPPSGPEQPCTIRRAQWAGDVRVSGQWGQPARGTACSLHQRFADRAAKRVQLEVGVVSLAVDEERRRSAYAAAYATKKILLHALSEFASRERSCQFPRIELKPFRQIRQELVIRGRPAKRMRHSLRLGRTPIPISRY